MERKVSFFISVSAQYRGAAQSTQAYVFPIQASIISAASDHATTFSLIYRQQHFRETHCGQGKSRI